MVTEEEIQQLIAACDALDQVAGPPVLRMDSSLCRRLLAERDRLAAENERLRSEAEATWQDTTANKVDRDLYELALSKVNAAEQELSRLRNMAREITCVWCGHQFVTKLQSQAAELYEHAKTCEKHPVSRLRAELGRMVASCDECDGHPGKAFSQLDKTWVDCPHCGPARRLLLAEGGDV